MFGWVLKPFALASTLAFSTLAVLSRRYERARFFFHLTLYISTLGVLSVWGVFVSILATAAGQRLNINFFVARSFYHVCSPLVGIRLHVDGEEHLTNLLTSRGGKSQSAVLVGNHQSFLDILYLGRIFPRRAAIMAKQELKWSPLLGQYMSLSGAVFVNRKNRKDAVRALEVAGDDMKKKGVSLWVFPEGTRSSSAECKMLSFKKGAFHLAVQAQVPIIPVVCENYWRIFDGRTRMDSGSLRIKVLAPISTIGLTSDDVTSLAESTRELMLATFRDISAPPPSQSDHSSTSLSSRHRETKSDEMGHLPAESEKLPSNAPDVELDAEGEDEDGGKDGGDETTEDEMDEDVVLLKRPVVVQ